MLDIEILLALKYFKYITLLGQVFLMALLYFFFKPKQTGF